MVEEQDGGLDRLNDLDVTWGFDLHAFLRERSQETPAAGDAGDGTAETIDSSQGGAVDASSVPEGRVETVDMMYSSQGGAVDASSVPTGRAETVETMDSSQGGAVDASLFQAGRAESDSGASAASGIDQENGDDPPAVLSGRAALSRWGRLTPTVRGRARSQRQHLEDESVQRLLKIQREVEDALYVAVQEWTESGSMLESTS